MTAQRRVPELPIIPARRAGVTGLRVYAFLAILVGLALRLLFVLRFPASADDSGAYVQLARNWADHHVYGLWLNGHLVPTDLRMPGYPAFLAGVAALLRRSTGAIALCQAVLDLGTCFLASALSAALAPVTARRYVAIAALWLAVTCPFVANYSAVVLTEVLTTFLATAALLSLATGLRTETGESDFPIFHRRLTPLALASLGGVLTGIATLVRPEMALLLAVGVAIYAMRWWRLLGTRKTVLTCTAMACAFLLPLAPWAARNFVTLHEIQILTPRYTTMPGEYAPVGYYAWTRTWLERFRDVYSNVWKIGEEPVETDDLPSSAFDSPQERTRVANLFEQYNKSPTLDISPELDHQFAEIAQERTRRHPLRTYLQVPFERALTLWFTPRTELLPIDGNLFPVKDQWEDSHAAFLTTVGFAALGYIYVALALGGIWVAWRTGRTKSGSSDSPNLWGIALLLAYMVVRTIFLTTVEAPEPRYVVTCYPAVLALASLFLAGNRSQE